jgi:hypothetical protein
VLLNACSFNTRTLAILIAATIHICVQYLLYACSPPIQLSTQTLGLYCQHSISKCGICANDTCNNAFSVCKDLADISGLCSSAMCQSLIAVVTAITASIILLSIAVACDGLEACMTFRPMKQLISFKNWIEGVASLVKWLAFGLPLAFEAQRLNILILKSYCFNDVGQSYLESSLSILYSAYTFCALSGSASLSFTIINSAHLFG